MRLRNRIALAAVIVIIATGLLLGLLSIRELRQTLESEDASWSAAMAQAVAKAVTTETLAGDKVAVRDVLRRVKETNDELVYLLVVDFKGNVFASTFQGKVPGPLAMSHRDCPLGKMSHLDINGTRVKDISYPLIDGLDAHLHIGINEAMFAQVINGSTRSLVWSILGIGILGAVGALFIGQRISRPISELSNALHSYGKGVSLEEIPPIKSPDREIDELYQSFRGMVEKRTEAEAQLRESEAYNRMLFDTSPIGLALCRMDGSLVDINQAYAAIIGRSIEATKQLSYWDITPVDYAEEEEAQLEQLRKHGHYGPYEKEYLHEDGRRIPVRLRGHLIERDSKQYIWSSVEDITERKHAEEELRKLNEELEERVRERTAKIQEQATILDQIHDAVISTDMHGIITSWNKGAENLFGYSAEEVTGKNIMLVYPEDQRPDLHTRVAQPVIDNGEHEIEVIMQRKDGARFDAMLSLTLMRDKQGQPISMVGYALDITARKQAEQRLQLAMQQAEEASRAKSDFLSRMSHELRTPMNAILGFSQLLEQNMDGNLSETELEYVSEVLKGGRHLLDLINEVLDLSRIESGKMQISLETVEMNELVEECIALVRPMADKNQINITSPDTRKTILVTADRMRLKQVILNLLSNAVKYNRIGGLVELKCEKTDGSYRVSIRDTGPGIPEALQSRVFDPFDRLNADASSVEGTGIGLSLAKRLTEFMGGRIGFNSVEGEGSTFWVELEEGTGLPVISLTEELPVMQQNGSDDKRHKVLYVEDNPANLRLIAHLIEKHGGIQLYDTHSASLALDLIRANKFELILLDIHLSGGESGFDILNRLRADPVLREIPVLAISANATPRDVERGLEAGFLEYITKPIDVHQFNAVLERYLGDEA